MAKGKKNHNRSRAASVKPEPESANRLFGSDLPPVLKVPRWKPEDRIALVTEEPDPNAGGGGSIGLY